MHTRSLVTASALLLAALGCGDHAQSPTEPHATPQADVAAATALSLRQVSAGYQHSCGVTTENQAYCWGDNSFGALGDGTRTLRKRPTRVAGTLRWRQVIAGFHITCGVTTDYRAYCWGANSEGQLGIGTNTGPETCMGLACSSKPLRVAGGLRFRQVSAYGHGGHTCGVTYPDNRAYCWGTSGAGALGDGTNEQRLAPVAVAGGLFFRHVSVGHQHTCGVTTANTVFCWGDNQFGQLGDSTHVWDRWLPTPVAGVRQFQQVEAGAFHTCAVTTAAHAVCWGDGHTGQIGDGKTYDRNWPKRVAGGLSWVRVTAGGGVTANGGHSCGVTSGDRMYCWGRNWKGALGDGTTTDRLTPVAVAGSIAFSQVSAGVSHTCGVTSSGVGYCWGLNRYAQLGDGTGIRRLTPTPIAGPT